VVDVLLHLQSKLGIATATTLDLMIGFYFQAFAVPKIEKLTKQMNILFILGFEELGVSTTLPE
jgi:hypothetical protein